MTEISFTLKEKNLTSPVQLKEKNIEFGGINNYIRSSLKNLKIVKSVKI